MKYCIMGDIHGDIAAMYKFVIELQNRYDEEFASIIHVGDFGIFSNERVGTDYPAYLSGRVEAPIPTFVCPGNHESWLDLMHLRANPLKNITLLTDGGITDIFGLRVGAIWGNMGAKDWADPMRLYNRRKYQPTAAACTHIERASVERLKDAGEFDMLITHDAPVGAMPVRQPSVAIKRELGLDPDEFAMGCPGFNELHLTGKPDFHFFGHFHSYRVCEMGNPQRRQPAVVALGCFNYTRENSYWIYER